MLAKDKGKLINGYVPDYVVFDIETTGIDPSCEEVIEISALKVTGGVVTDEFSTLVNPGIHITYTISSITGIMDDMVKDSPCFETAFREFLDFAGDLPLVGHNVQGFDLKFLYRDALKFWGKTVGNDYIDTLILSRIYLPDLERHNLASIATYYGISTEGAHRALNDCMMTQQIYEKIREEMENPSDASKSVKRCPRCGNLLKRRDGKFGPFYGCRSYPDCKYTEDIKK